MLVAIRSPSTAGTTDAQERVCNGGNEKPGAYNAYNGEDQEIAYNGKDIVICRSNRRQNPANSTSSPLLSVFCHDIIMQLRL